jgi:hypothetical protein
MSVVASLNHYAPRPKDSMHIQQLQHVIYEIGRRLELKELYIIGSAAILAVLPNPPEGELAATRDVDVIPPNDDESLATRIDFLLGEASDFDDENGYYAQGVTSKTPEYAPTDWKSRTIAVEVGETVGRCMGPHDLVLSKLGAGRPKDLDFARAAAKLNLVQRDKLIELLPQVEGSEEIRKLITGRISAIFSTASGTANAMPQTGRPPGSHRTR